MCREQRFQLHQLVWRQFNPVLRQRLRQRPRDDLGCTQFKDFEVTDFVSRYIWVQFSEQFGPICDRFVRGLQLLSKKFLQEQLRRFVEIYCLGLGALTWHFFAHLRWEQGWVAEQPSLTLMHREMLAEF